MQDWEISVWGVRGSAPVPSKKFMEYGGNTSCFSVKRGNHVIIFDMGTGLTALGRELIKQKIMRFDILLSHLHIDHLLGLFSFQPFFCPEAEIHLYGRIGLEENIKQLLSPPWYPLEVKDFAAKIYFHEIEPKKNFYLDKFLVSTIKGNHPDGSILYRLDGDGKSFTYALDCECDKETFLRLSKFAHESDLMVWDSYFIEEDLRKGWGHSTWKQGIEIAHKANIKQVLMAHYNSEYIDIFLHEQEEIACEDKKCIFSKEGMRLRI